MDAEAVTTLLRRQHGVVSRRQVLAAAGDDDDIERLVRRREWARAHRGVFVEHTGPLTWQQRSWAAVLLHWPAALAGRSALEAHGVLPPSTASAGVELAVDRARRVDDPPGVRTRQVTGFADLALMHLSPPRMRIEHAVLAVASRARTDDAAVAVLADAVQQRRTNPGRLLATLASQSRLPRRALLHEVLDDVAVGAHSALERRHLRDAERAHGLPVAARQVRAADGRTAYRDVLHAAQATVVELDGRVGHEAAADVWDDLDRDVDAAAGGLLTLRVGWRHVLEPCRLASRLGDVLRARGWQGAPVPCPTCRTGEVLRRGVPVILARPERGAAPPRGRPGSRTGRVERGGVTSGTVRR